MTPDKNIAFTKGEDYSFALTFDYAIVGFTYAAKIKTKAGATVATFTTSTDTATKTATFSLTHTATALLTAGYYRYDVYETGSGGNVRRIVRGYVNISNGVTI